MQNIHTHVWDTKVHFSEKTIKETELSRGYPLDLSVRFETFMKEMAPFEKVAVFGLKARLTGYWVPDQYVADFVGRAPEKLVGFASCDPTQPAYLEELRYGIESLHLTGLKMGPIYAGFDPRDQRCCQVYRYCQEHGVPILFHTGTTFNSNAPLEFSRPILFDEVAIKFPGLKIVLAHMGHPFYEECLVVVRKHSQVYADIAALFYRPWQYYNIFITAQEYRVTHKILFGTDYPIAGTTESIDGLRSVNDLVKDTALPKVSSQVIAEIMERDSFQLLGIKV